MEAPSTCALMDSLLKLPGRLDGIVRHGYMLPKGAEQEILLIKRDLEEIIDLSNMEDTHAMIVRCWTKEVRELSYDIEDFVDQYEHDAAGLWSGHPIRRSRAPTRKIKWRRRSKTLAWLHEKLRQRLWMANKIREFSLRTQEALQRHRMYNLGGIARTAFSTRYTDASSGSSSHPAPCGDHGILVGIAAAKDKLEELLVTMHDEHQQSLKVVSIVGFGGLGKTTLANELYHKLGPQFECRAFVRTSQKPDLRRIFISMLSQVCPQQPLVDWKVHNLISSIRTHLQNKRYFIVVDDLWATSTWDIIKCALPNGNNSSRILTTTEIEDLALQCSCYDSKYVFKMEPLGEHDSRKLYFTSVFGPQRECPPELREVSYDIIRKCGGLPLAIVTVASILSSQLGIKEQWDCLNKSLGYSLMTNPTFEGMKQVLNLGYNNLPRHLKACMLYLSIYQEDNIIWKDDLVKQWVAEGFIHATEGQDKQEISRAYFDELVSRNMIQPVHINDNGEVLSCVVHHMVLNLIITYNSIEENFVTAIHHSQANSTLADKVRRLSLHFGNAEDAMSPRNMRLSQVRTLAYFGVFKCMPSFVEFRLLQVLILHFWGDKDSISLNLTRIAELFRLRYLKVTSNVALELHNQMRGLHALETLTIDARVSALPSDIVHLPGLLHLSLPAETNLPNGIGHMTSLRTLKYFDLYGNSMENVQSLSMLTNLRDLQLTCCCTVQEAHKLMSQMQFRLRPILGKLSNLKSLSLVPTASYDQNSLNDDAAKGMNISSDGLTITWLPQTLLQRLQFSPRICIFSCLPKCVGQLGNLCILKIGVKKISREDIDVLRRLPVLAVLSLYVHTKPAEWIVVGKAGFLVLKYLKFKCCDPRLMFEQDAMPNLRKLKLGFNASRADQQRSIPVGIEHLSGLKEISAKIGGSGPEESHRRAAELAFRDAIRVHTSCQRVNIQCVKQIIGCKEDQSSITREEDYGTKILSFKKRKEYEIVDVEDSDVHDDIMQEVSDQEMSKIADSRFTLHEWHILLLLRNKLDNQHDDVTRSIPIVDVYSNDPWKLARIATGQGQGPLFYFRPLQEKDAMGIVPIQTPSGYWKGTGSPGYIYSAERLSVGMKRTMEFYRDHATSGTKTGWKIKEFITAFQNAAAGGIGTLMTPRSEMSLCQLYTESTTNPAGSAGRSPAGLLSRLQQEGHMAAKQYEIPEDDPSENNEVDQHVSGESASKEADKRKRTTKQSTKYTLTSSPYADGYNWMKYGQKDILGAKYPSGYFRCSHRNQKGCKVIKTVQPIDEDPQLFHVFYFGEHTCDQSSMQLRVDPGEAAMMSSSLTTGCPAPAAYGHLLPAVPVQGQTISPDDDDYSWRKYGQKDILGAKHPRKRMEEQIKHQMRVQVSSAGDSDTLDDGHSWRKYGQKEILGAKHPRGYYRCTHRHSQGCAATKQVQRTNEDPTIFDVAYFGTHTCVQTAHSTDRSGLSGCATGSTSSPVSEVLSEKDMDISDMGIEPRITSTMMSSSHY